MIQKQKPPTRVGEGEQPKTAKVVEVPAIDDLAEKMKKATESSFEILVCAACGYVDCPNHYNKIPWKQYASGERHPNSTDHGPIPLNAGPWIGRPGEIPGDPPPIGSRRKYRG